MSASLVAITSHGLIGGSSGSLPDAYDVRDGVDRGDGTLGTLTSPAENDVRIDIQYGGDGTEFTGSLASLFPPLIIDHAEIKRTTENFLCNQLGTFLPDTPFFPFTGGSQSTDATYPEPPYVVVHIHKADRMFATESTWTVYGKIKIFNNMSESTSEDHAILVQSVYTALDLVATGEITPAFSFHGLDFTTHEGENDEARKTYVDVINIVCGVGG